MIVVEVISPSSSTDTGAKLAGYFALQSVRHYLVVNTITRVVTHHLRETDGAIATRIVREGSIALEPPGIEIDLERIFTTR